MTLLDSHSLGIEDVFILDPDALYQQLLASITWDDRIRSRKAASFGLPYNYSGTIWPENSFPEPLLPIVSQVELRVGYHPNNCLALYYSNGKSSLGYHSDSVTQMVPETGIAVISLGEERMISFRHQVSRQVEQYLLKNGSLLYMDAEMQAEWKHAVLVDKKATGGRISLAFRCLLRSSDGG